MVVRVDWRLPEPLHERLVAAAALERRTVPAQALVLLEAGLGGEGGAERLASDGRHDAAGDGASLDPEPLDVPSPPSPDDRPLWQKRLDANKKS